LVTLKDKSRVNGLATFQTWSISNGELDAKPIVVEEGAFVADSSFVMPGVTVNEMRDREEVEKR
jgi:acetyltransferase-like isoleucine patch superfamily enzyme